MSSYIRPAIALPAFHDADGHVIEYGNRWLGSPPEGTYSIDTHLERFAPLHDVADALIAHLREAYDVEIHEGADAAHDLTRPAPHTFLRAVRVQPRDPRCASLTFVFTAYPGILIHAGLLHDFASPRCGCHACDATWPSEADELERVVFAVVAGGYRETIQIGRQPWVGYSMTDADGSSAGQVPASDLPPQRLTDAARAFDALPDGWHPWPRTSPAV